MICQLYLSKVLKVPHTIETTLGYYGLRNVITFTEINVKAKIIDLKTINKGNKLSLNIESEDWDKLSNHVNNWNKGI